MFGIASMDEPADTTVATAAETADDTLAADVPRDQEEMEEEDAEAEEEEAFSADL